MGLIREHKQARDISIKDIDFSRLESGIWNGHYDGGMYGWRENSVMVTVGDGRVTQIVLQHSAESNDYTLIYRQIIAAQSLLVDGISGATLTSRAYIKGVENALLQAKKE